MAGVIVLVAVLIAATAYGLLWRRRDGTLKASAQERTVTEADLGAPLGERATLVQFSTPVCARCGPTRRLLLQVAGEVPGVSHVEIDAAERLDLARRLRVQTTPTVLVLRPDGSIVRRASGQPRRADVLAAIGEAEGRS